MEAGKIDNNPQSCMLFNLNACREKNQSDTVRAKNSHGLGRIGFNPDLILVFIVEINMENNISHYEFL
jgi:hypothetical protein